MSNWATWRGDGHDLTLTPSKTVIHTRSELGDQCGLVTMLRTRVHDLLIRPRYLDEEAGCDVIDTYSISGVKENVKTTRSPNEWYRSAISC